MSAECSSICSRAGASSPRLRAEDSPAPLALTRYLIICLIFLVTTSVPGVAQEIRLHAPTAAPQPAAVDEPYSYPKILLAMGLVVGLIFALKWAAAKVAPGVSPKPGKAMSILSRMPVGPKQQLILIKVGRRAVLIGHAGAQMNPLCEITDADEVAHLVGQSETEKMTLPLNGFASLFKKREREFEPTEREIAQAAEPEEDEQLAQLARRELLGLTERVRGLSQEMNGV